MPPVSFAFPNLASPAWIALITMPANYPAKTPGQTPPARTPGQNPRPEPSGQNQKSTNQRLMLFQIHRMASLGRFYQPVRSIIICAFVAFSARAEIGRVSGLNDPHDATSVSGETAALTGNS